jgi:hypothetical protein
MIITINKDNKWRIDIHEEGGKLRHIIAIPPKDSGERIDYISRNCNYHYNYIGAISHGIIVHIKDGKAELKHIPYGIFNRLRRIL